MRTIKCKEDLTCGLCEHRTDSLLCPTCKLTPYTLSLGDKVIFNVKGEMLTYKVAILIGTCVSLMSVGRKYLALYPYLMKMDRLLTDSHSLESLTRLVISLYEEIEKGEPRTIEGKDLPLTDKTFVSELNPLPCPEYGDKHDFKFLLPREGSAGRSFIERDGKRFEVLTIACPCGSAKKVEFKII